MVRYRYTGHEMLWTAQTTGGAVVNIANNGLTIITSTAAERYVMSPPIIGCRKTLLFLAATSSGVDRTVELSSVSSGDTITVVVGTGVATGTEITCNATVATVVDLVGLTTAQWHVLGTKAVLDSTGIVFGAS